MALPGRKFVVPADRRTAVDDRILGNTVPVGTFQIGDVKHHQNGAIGYYRVALHDEAGTKIGYASDSRMFGLTALYRLDGTDYVRVPRGEMSAISSYNELEAANNVTITELPGTFFARVYEENQPVLNANGEFTYREAHAYRCEFDVPVAAETPVAEAPQQ